MTKESGFETLFGQEFSFFHIVHTGFEATQKVPGAISPEIKRPRNDTDD
jgi:hypothetical protein